MGNAILKRVLFDQNFKNITNALQRNGGKSMFTSKALYPHVAEPYPILKISGLAEGEYGIHCYLYQDVQSDGKVIDLLALELQQGQQESVATVVKKIDEFSSFYKMATSSENSPQFKDLFGSQKQIFSGQLARWIDVNEHKDFVYRLFLLLGEGVRLHMITPNQENTSERGTKNSLDTGRKPTLH